MWFVLISQKGGYYVHSIHGSEHEAKAWSRCKEHDGADVAVAHADATVVAMVEEYCEQLRAKRKE